MKNGGSLAGGIEFILTLSSSRPVVLLTATFFHRKFFVLGLGLLYVGVEESRRVLPDWSPHLSLQFADDEQHND